LTLTGDIVQADAILAKDEQRGQDLLDCLTVLPTGAQKLGASLHGRLTALFPSLALATQSKYAVVRYAVARCFAALCDIVPTEGLKHVVEGVIPVLGDPLNVDNRRGAIELISRTFPLTSSARALTHLSPI
jgi:TATA-binding protein-associated factor